MRMDPNRLPGQVHTINHLWRELVVGWGKDGYCNSQVVPNTPSTKEEEIDYQFIKNIIGLDYISLQFKELH